MASRPPPRSAPEPELVVDRAALRAQVDGDDELLAEMIAIFFEDGPRLLAETAAAAAQRDGRALERAAHSLKGSLSAFHAPAAVAVARRLEQIGRGGNLAEAERTLALLNVEHDRLRETLLAVCEECLR
jgi:HPt (histidine-containing phosphotransfer) domain-containing protein